MKIHNHQQFLAKLVSHVSMSKKKGFAEISIIHPNSKKVLLVKEVKAETYEAALEKAKDLKSSLSHIETQVQEPMKKGKKNGKVKNP